MTEETKAIVKGASMLCGVIVGALTLALIFYGSLIYVAVRVARFAWGPE